MEIGELILFTVTFSANPANDLTCPPSYIMIKKTRDSHERDQLAYAFVVTSPQRSFVVAAEDPEERDAWINAMRDAAEEQWAYEFEVSS